ncbi:MAG: carbohydrate-binding domain-containing protein [Janthinobacterium lividum]
MFVKNTLVPNNHFLSKINKLAIPSLLLAGLVLALGGCNKSSSSTVSEPCVSCTIDSSGITSGTAEGSTATGYNADDLVENSTFSNVVTIDFGSTITITNPLSTNGVTITQSNGAVIINSSASGVEYQLSGLTTNGSVKIYSSNLFKLTLNGINITNANGPAINIQSSKKAFIVLADNTINSLTDGTTYVTSTENMNGTVFSEGQMIFSGNGTLSVTGNYKYGIVSDDYIRIRSGNINIANALSDGIHTTNAFIADGGYLTLTAQANGINCEAGYIIINGGTYILNPVNDAITASYTGTSSVITPYVTVNGGNFTIKSTTGAGVESKSALTINNATISANTTTDGLYGGTAVYINSGSNIYCYSTGSNAMESGGTFTITGGKVIGVAKLSAKAGIYCGARTFKITGGEVIGTGGVTSAPSATASTVHSVILGSGSAIEIIHFETADATEALTFLAPQAYSTLLFASAKLKAGTAYNVYFGGTAAGISFNGLYLQGAYYKVNTKSSSFTTSSIVTQAGGTISTN